jgi:Ni/Co efflux regulator RcnB
MKNFVVAAAAVLTIASAVPAAAQSVDQREQHQEQRIRQGEASGQLTPAESRRLRFLEMRLHRTEARMRWRNGGQLSPSQRRRLQQEENRESAAINRLKHNYR